MLSFYTGVNTAQGKTVEREDGGAKFWLDPVYLESSRGFGRVEIRRIGRLLEGNRESLLRLWHE